MKNLFLIFFLLGLTSISCVSCKRNPELKSGIGFSTPQSGAKNMEIDEMPSASNQSVDSVRIN